MVTSKLALMCHRGEVARRATWKNFSPHLGGRPTNRRSVMRKMQSVPILDTAESKRNSSVISTSGSGRRPRTHSINGRPLRRSRHRSPSRDGNSVRSSSQRPARKLPGSERRGRKKRSGDASETSSRRRRKKEELAENNNQEEAKESGTEDSYKSFLDQNLDDDVDGHGCGNRELG